MGLDVSHLQQQLDELEPSAISKNPSAELAELHQSETVLSVKAAPAIQDTGAQEKEFDEDIDDPSEKNIAVAQTIEAPSCAWTLACCYFWLTSKNMSERKDVMFNTPKPFLEMVTKNLCSEVPDQAEWTTWNRIYGHVLENFLTSKENIKNYKQALEEVMCNKSHWWREKYLANSELPII